MFETMRSFRANFFIATGQIIYTEIVEEEEEEEVEEEDEEQEEEILKYRVSPLMCS